jgi:alkylation response protein AidB-like acyl-CoA dehydrogenase
VLGHTSPAFRSVIGTNNGIGSQGLVMDGTEAQKARYLPKMASGEIIGSFALTEPDVGSDSGSVKTSARRDGDDFVINGTKRYITNAPSAQLFTVFARTDPDTPAGAGSRPSWWTPTLRASARQAGQEDGTAGRSRLRRDVRRRAGAGRTPSSAASTTSTKASPRP